MLSWVMSGAVALLIIGMAAAVLLAINSIFTVVAIIVIVLVTFGTLTWLIHELYMPRDTDY